MTFYVPIKNLMSLSIVSVSNVFYFRQKSTEVDLDDKKNELAVAV